MRKAVELSPFHQLMMACICVTLLILMKRALSCGRPACLQSEGAYLAVGPSTAQIAACLAYGECKQHSKYVRGRAQCQGHG